MWIIVKLYLLRLSHNLRLSYQYEKAGYVKPLRRLTLSTALDREYQVEAMLIKKENKNQNKQCGAVNPVHEYLIFPDISRKLVSHTMWKLNMSLFHIATTLDASETVKRASDGQNSV